MVRFEFNIDKEDIERIIRTTLKYGVNNYVNHWEKFGFKDYKYHFVYDDGKQNFWIAYEFLLKDKLSLHSRTAVIEFNPNKNGFDGMLLRFMRALAQNSRKGSIKIKGCDVALDLKVPRDNIFYSRDYYKRSVDLYENHSKTSYIGKRGWGGTKIYDKAKERGVDGDWTRIEFTIQLNFPLFEISSHHGNWYKMFNESFISMSIPTIYVTNYSQDVDVRYRCYLFALECGKVDLKEFNRHTRDKIKQIMSNSAELIIDNSVKPYLARSVARYLDTWVNVIMNDMPF